MEAEGFETAMWLVRYASSAHSSPLTSKYSKQDDSSLCDKPESPIVMRWSGVVSVVRVLVTLKHITLLHE